MRHQSYAEAIQAHYSSVWAPPSYVKRWVRGPVEDLPVDFRVLVIPRTAETTAYATQCMSQCEDTGGRIELHILTRSAGNAQESIVELLTAVAHFHRTAARLDLGHTVNFGRPWLPGSSCDYGLVSLPYLDGPRLEWMTESMTRFLWLVPVTQSEVQFKKRFGLEALEEKFESEHFDYLDPFRTPVV